MPCFNKEAKETAHYVLTEGVLVLDNIGSKGVIYTSSVAW